MPNCVVNNRMGPSVIGNDISHQRKQIGGGCTIPKRFVTNPTIVEEFVSTRYSFAVRIFRYYLCSRSHCMGLVLSSIILARK